MLPVASDGVEKEDRVSIALPADQVALIGIVVALLQTLLLALAGWVAWFQLRETAKSRYLEAVVRMFEDFGSKEAYAEADDVLGLPERIEDFSTDEIELATWATRVYEKIAFLVESEMIPEEFIVPLYSRRIVWSWEALNPFVERQRQLRDTGGAYRMGCDGFYFERLYKRTARYRRREFRGDRRLPAIPAAYREQLRQRIASGARVAPRDE